MPSAVAFTLPQPAAAARQSSILPPIQSRAAAAPSQAGRTRATSFQDTLKATRRPEPTRDREVEPQDDHENKSEGDRPKKADGEDRSAARAKRKSAEKKPDASRADEAREGEPADEAGEPTDAAAAVTDDVSGDVKPVDGDAAEPDAEPEDRDHDAEHAARAADPRLVPGQAAAATADPDAEADFAQEGPSRVVSSVAGGAGTAGIDLNGEAPDGEAEATGTDVPSSSPFGSGGIGTARVGARPGTGAARGPAETADVDAGAEGVASQASATASGGALSALDLVEQFTQAFAEPSVAADQPAAGHESIGANAAMSADPVGSVPQSPLARDPGKVASPAAAPEPSPEARFAAANHERIVTAAKAELMPNGGKMTLRLDPPELGPLQVSLHVRDGVVTAAFQTSNDDAARMLSHSLSDLRGTLEAQGISVDKLHVQQAPKDEQARNGDQNGRPQHQAAEDRGDNRRDQQRKDAVQRLWDKLAGKGPLDVLG